MYTMLIPKAGEFRLVLESCWKVKIESAEFFASQAIVAEDSVNDKNECTYDNFKNATSIKFDDTYIQGFKFLYVSETLKSERKIMRNPTYPVRRGFVTQKGVLKFKIIPDNGPFLVAKKTDYYALMTEFRPFGRQQNLKGYVEIYEDQDDLKGRKSGGTLWTTTES